MVYWVVVSDGTLLGTHVYRIDIINRITSCYLVSISIILSPINFVATNVFPKSCEVNLRFALKLLRFIIERPSQI